MTPRLASLLTRNHELKPEYRGGLSNHLSMGLFSLTALGGSDTQLSAFAEASWAPLEPLSAEHATEVTQDSFARQLRKPEALNGFRTLFQREVSTLGRAETLRKYLSTLLPGLGAAGFHALIRTAYGVRFENDDEVVDGLSYWATAFLPLGSLAEPGEQTEPRALLDRLRHSRALAGQRGDGALILERMRNAAQLPELALTVDALAPGADTLAKIAAAAVHLYTSSHGDFTALHTVTATHAFRLLQPYLRRNGPGVRYLWQAFVAAYVALHAPAIGEPALPASLPEWDAIVTKALLSTDAHDLKLVDIAREEGAFYQQPIYRYAAALRLGMI
jgi:hypothetical protein